jgi:hypothetical protein
MNFDNPRLLSLGTFTWAALQAAYPNGGGALAALPAGVTATVTNAARIAPVLMTPNAAKTFWVSVNANFTVASFAGSLSVPLYTWAGAAGDWAPAGGAITFPSNLLQAGQSIRVTALYRKRNANAAAAFRIYLGTSGTSADGVVWATSITAANSDAWRFTDITVASATRFTTTDYNVPNNTQIGSVSDGTANVNFASPMILTFRIDSINALDFVDLIMVRVEVFS